MAAYGDTYFFDYDEDETGHLHVVVTEPTPSGHVVTVSVSTRNSKSDAMVPLNVGDHPYIKRPSVISFRFSAIRTVTDIDRVIANGDASPREPMDEKFLRRARNGVKESDFAPYEVKDFLGALEKYKNEG